MVILTHYAPTILYVGVIFVLGTADSSSPVTPQINDKLAHLAAFALMWWLMARTLSAAQVKAPWLLGAVIATGLGVALEAVQMVVPHRSAELGDLAADLAGVLAALTLAWVVRSLRNGADAENRDVG